MKPLQEGDVMSEGSIPEYHGEAVVSDLGPLRADTSIPLPAVRGRLNGAANRGLVSWPEPSLEESIPDILGRCKTQRNLTEASLPQIRRNLAQAWRLMLASRINEAVGVIDRIELQLDDVSPAIAKRFRMATRLLRATGLALQDDSLAALPIAVSQMKDGETNRDYHAASTLYRLGVWQLGDFEVFYSLPRHQPGVQLSKACAISAMIDLSVDAAVALDHLHLSAAKRLASDALEIAKVALREMRGLAALPACLVAQVLYEEGYPEEADVILREQLPIINAEGSIECAMRAYLVLAGIARHRKKYDVAALLLREAEALGERRGWPRLVAACLAERASLLLQGGRTKEAGCVAEYLDRYAESHRAGAGHSCAEVMRYRILTRWRVSWAKAPSREAVAALRELYHQAIQRRNFYVGCQLAVELTEMLMVIGESEEAVALFFCTIKAGAAAGLYQIFLEGGAELGMLLKETYARAGAPGSTDRELLPVVGSLLLRRDARCAGGRSAHPRRRVCDTLTARERDILGMISQGFSNKRIARAFEISPETVKSHVKRIFSKLAVSSRTEAVSRAGSLGLL
jgi:LuxR family maltose regulon positive regulatory protein